MQNNNNMLDFELIVNNIIGGVKVCQYNKEFTILYVNKGFIEITGYSQEDIKAMKNHLAFVFPEDGHVLTHAAQQQLQLNNRFTIEYRIIKKNGQIIWVLDKGILIQKPGQEDYVQCIITDITEHKSQEQLLLQKTFELETITNNTQAAIIRCSFDRSFKINYANDGFFRMIGYTREEFSKKCNNCIGGIIHPNDVEEMHTSHATQLEHTNSTVHIHRLIHKDGNSIWIIAKGTVVTKSTGKQEFHGVFTDITEQKEIEEAIRISEKKYIIAMRESGLTMFDYNIATKKINLYENDIKEFNLPPVLDNAVENLMQSGFIKSESLSAFKEFYQQIESGVPSATTIIHMTKPSGLEGIFEFRLTNIFDSSGKPIVAVGVKKDITELVKLEREQQYGNSMIYNHLLVFEANITTDKIINCDQEWLVSIGNPDTSSFSNLMEYICQNIIYHEDVELVRNNFNTQNILNIFENGQRFIVFEYRKQVTNSTAYWFKNNINIIKDKFTGDIIIRSYTINIHELKIKELKVQEEQQLYENMRFKASKIYTVDIGKNLFISGHESWGELFGIERTNNYSEMMQALGEKAIHPEDKELFENIFLRHKVLEAYDNGKTEIHCDYRRPDENGNFIWVRCTMHLFEEPYTHSLKGHSYIEVIDEEKKRELELIYKSEHDLLTEFYNKITTEKYITDFLTSSEGKAGKHAFFIIDVDHFKLINDNFGHAFGDAVLSQIARKISVLFRDIDILGRIGGDEFVIFMKNIQSNTIAMSKAIEICEKVQDTYTQHNKNYKISASIGIAFYPEHGRAYDELYKKSDTAMYVSKENNRNQFTIYSDNLDTMASGINEIMSSDFTNVKSFNENVTEYVFRILYESSDKITAINSVLELIGKHYDLSRVYIFEDSYYGDYTSNTFEWCNTGIESQIAQLQNLSYKNFKDYKNNFNADGIFYLQGVNELTPSLLETVEPNDIKTTLQYAIMKSGVFKGFVGFDECISPRAATKKEIADLRNISKILGLFVMEMRAIEEINFSKNLTLSIINSLDFFAYICNPNTYELLFANSKTLEVVSNAHIGKTCYDSFLGRTEPCTICPMRIMVEKKLKNYSVDISSSKLGKRIRAHASWINWVDEQKMCLIHTLNTSKFMTT